MSKIELRFNNYDIEDFNIEEEKNPNSREVRLDLHAELIIISDTERSSKDKIKIAVICNDIQEAAKKIIKEHEEF